MPDRKAGRDGKLLDIFPDNLAFLSWPAFIGGRTVTEEEKEARKSFAVVLRGEPADFVSLMRQAKASGLYVVYTKTSAQRLVVEEMPW